MLPWKRRVVIPDTLSRVPVTPTLASYVDDLYLAAQPGVSTRATVTERPGHPYLAGCPG
jgi:hypothetical protein